MPWLTYIRMAPWAAILALMIWAGRLNDLRDRWHHQYTAEHAARISDRVAYEQAQRDATAANKAQVQSTEEKYQRISNDEKRSFEADRDRLRAELGKRLQQGAAPAAPGATGATASPQNPAPSGGADGASQVCIPTGDYVSGAETENQLEHLIRYVEQVLSVDPNK